MRIDKYLKLVGAFKSREQARKACNEGFVRVNGEKVKPSRSVSVGEVIEIETPVRLLKLRVLAIPKGNVSKKDRLKFAEIMEDRHIKPHETSGFWDELPGEEL